MTKASFILSIDQSTSGTKALLVNEEGAIVQKRSLPHKQHYPQTGWVEHDPIEIYENVKKAAASVIKDSNTKPGQIAVLAITNQRETIVVWEKETGTPIYNAIVWQCRRTADECRNLQETGNEELVRQKTGLTIDPYFSASKVKWILDHVEGARDKAEAGSLLLGTIDSWLIWKLTKGAIHATDFTNASRTLLFNIHSLAWDKELLRLFTIPETMLPEVKDSNAIFGKVVDEAFSQENWPISGVIGDSQGALFGQKCFEAGMVKATYGTGTSVMMQTDKPVTGTKGLVTSIAWGMDGKVQYALEGIINSTGDVLNWMTNELGLISDLTEAEHLAQALPGNEGVYLVPAFVGLGAPYWSPNTRAAIVGMNRNTGRSHIIRAAFESIAYQVTDILKLMEQEAGIEMKELRVDGGATCNRFLMQYQADMLDIPVDASDVAELSAMGSVYLAGLGVGIWKTIDEVKTIQQNQQKYDPSMCQDMKIVYYNGWKSSVQSVLV
ncbi:glycerol kinase GlpK [Domibacillus sp. A3M-37]|uniref:glycerol kinase GlpK n=1 Tax=Domibacillus sp. A3M-37 TaxID=2962037 RepID=UPI0020B80BC3|nr:glycerol kinase GlpK [Domibacillus sp. A3M-37]MCP3763708.1 glycerol kinase GlpK [Domibacillus sp. A3M-37]